MPTPLPLKALLEQHNFSQRRAAEAAGISRAAFCSLVGKGAWPKTADREAIKLAVGNLLRDAGAAEADIRTAFTKPRKAAKADESQQKENVMLLRRQGLMPETKRHFGLMRDPFAEIESREDVFMSGEIKYVRESMWQVAKNGGFLAVVGESGSGKSTLRRELQDRVNREEQTVRLIEPYVLAMEDNDKTGKTLKSLHIAEAIMATVAPQERILNSPESRFRQLHRVLRDSCRAGYSHCLIIEEAHGLSLPTIKHLKRFLELEDGFRRLLSVILLGQPELQQKLSETSHAVREVVQRCEVVDLRPMNGALPEYVRFKFERAQADASKIITEGGIEALRTKLTGPAPRAGSGRDSVSLVYPLAVGNMITAAMNLAADLKAKLVDEAIVAQV